MKIFLLSILILIYLDPVFAEKTTCLEEITGYKMVKNTTFPFTVNEKKACFFAFYTVNPDPMIDTKGNGNTGDAIWYGYYKVKNPTKIYEFPKPIYTNWTRICTIDAISFYSMHDNKKPDVTIIGSCDRNVINYTFPLVFVWKDGGYVLDKDVYASLYGLVGLTVADVREYIKSPKSTYKKLEERSHLN